MKSGMMAGENPLWSRISRVAIRVATLVAPPVMRIALALPFLRSGLTRWEDFGTLSPATIYLFEEMFTLHIFGGTYALPAPVVLAWVTACAELALPALLILGAGTRLAAMGLLAMTLVIQLVVPDGWANYHLYWAALALGILALGPGGLSVDRWIEGRARSRAIG